jgi:hypothetical protein
MNRRNFFSRLGAAVLGTYLAVQVKPLAFIKEALKEVKYLVPNPAWIDAPYEVSFMFAAGTWKDAVKKIVPIIHKTEDYNSWKAVLDSKDKILIQEHYPIRMDKNNNVIPPFIES